MNTEQIMHEIRGPVTAPYTPPTQTDGDRRCDHVSATAAEIQFLRGLTDRGWAGRGANIPALRNYAQVVMGGMRAYDPDVDVAKVHAEIRSLLAACGAEEETGTRMGRFNA